MDAKEIQEAYRRKLQNDSQLKQIRKKVAGGDLSALQKYSIRAGELSVETLQDRADDLGGSEEEMLDTVFRENYQAVENASQTAQKSANESSGFGLNPSTAAYVSTAAVFASKLSGYEDIHEGLNALKYDIVLQSQRYADDSERRSADFASNSGVEVLVSREYDDVGVHTTDKGGGEDCQWCKARCGTDVPYKEAYARGMFERHPGCGCIITYRTKRGVFRQGKGDWENNQWLETPSNVVQERISYSMSGDNIGLYLRTPSGKVQITDEQFGKKAGKHCADYGLDPSKKEDRAKFRSITQDIISNYDEKFSGEWRGQKGTCDFYLKGNDVVVVNRDENSYVTTMKGGINNARVKKARG